GGISLVGSVGAAGATDDATAPPGAGPPSVPFQPARFLPPGPESVTRSKVSPPGSLQTSLFRPPARSTPVANSGWSLINFCTSPLYFPPSACHVSRNCVRSNWPCGCGGEGGAGGAY